MTITIAIQILIKDQDAIQLKMHEGHQILGLGIKYDDHCLIYTNKGGRPSRMEETAYLARLFMSLPTVQ